MSPFKFSKNKTKNSSLLGTKIKAKMNDFLKKILTKIEFTGT